MRRVLTRFFCSKRVEAQLKDLSEKSDKKKMEARTSSVLLVHMRLTTSHQIVEGQTTLQQDLEKAQGSAPAVTA